MTQVRMSPCAPCVSISVSQQGLSDRDESHNVAAGIPQTSNLRCHAFERGPVHVATDPGRNQACTFDGILYPWDSYEDCWERLLH